MKNQPRKQNRNTEYPEGVFAARKKNGDLYFRSSLTCRRKHISLGSYATPELAHLAYLEGRALLSDHRYTLEKFSETSPLPFSKWVSLINYRDNGIYIGNPIYAGSRILYYYLSPSLVLKFDAEDLFYYSSHRIMRRGSHYFVADYGMQISIAGRYGIKAYAREGIDFRFINGDPTDFRRENLEILNVYHGVTVEQKKGQYPYTVRIHVKGNYLVGRYADRIEAAIAYNKAIDVLRKNGFQKKFIPNYIDGLPASRYAEIYTAVQISPKLAKCRPQPISPNNPQS